MRTNILFFLIQLLSLIAIDYIFWRQLRFLFKKHWTIILYWLHSLILCSSLVAFHFTAQHITGPDAYFWFGKIIGILFLFYTPKFIFIFFNTIKLIICRFFTQSFKLISRLGIVFSILLFLSILYGITWGRDNYKIETVELTFENLPSGFDGFTIIHLADLHLGSYGKSYKGIQKLVDNVNNLNGDIIVFTGDMVNNFAAEMVPWISVLEKMQAKYGKYAVTGNHDYGDYTFWLDSLDKKKNLVTFFSYMEQMGFKMLNNENTPIMCHSDTIILAGVENWGKPPFPRYGNLAKTMKHIHNKFVILLTHDPSHWRAEVLQFDIPLTLSGHTHAMQMGIKIGSKEWSPAHYVYPEYDGLYQEGYQYIYVSRGQGYIGFPGRIGLRPVITRIVLNSTD